MLAMEILQFCTKPSIWYIIYFKFFKIDNCILWFNNSTLFFTTNAAGPKSGTVIPSVVYDLYA